MFVLRTFFCSALTLFLAVSLCFSAVGFAADSDFVSGMEDLPLMPGLTEASDGGMVFATPTGRILEAEAFGPVARSKVLAFYGETLPQLGWVAMAPSQYKREGEVLRIEFSSIAGTSNSDLIVHFFITPAQ